MPDLSGEISAGETVLFKTFVIGILLGVIGAGAALYTVPAVDLVREPSIVRVSPNGGNIEVFHANVPMDRIMVAGFGPERSLPPGLEWPTDDVLRGLHTEVFKIRNEQDVVIGVAVREAATNGDENVIDWVLHLPARGSLFVTMDPVARQDGHRAGNIVAGSREFEPFSGVMTERWVVNPTDEEDAPIGHIELSASYVGQLERLDPGELTQ